MNSRKIIEMLKVLGVTKLPESGIPIYGKIGDSNKFLVVDNTSKSLWDLTFILNEDLYNQSEDDYRVDYIWYRLDEEYKIYTFVYDTISHKYEDHLIGTISEEDLIKNGIEIFNDYAPIPFFSKGEN